MRTHWMCFFFVGAVCIFINIPTARCLTCFRNYTYLPADLQGPHQTGVCPTEMYMCVKVDAEVMTNTGQRAITYGECISRRKCKNPQCADYRETLTKINKSIKLTNCNISCCSQDNCNSPFSTSGKPLNPVGGEPQPDVQVVSNTTIESPFLIPPSGGGGADAGASVMTSSTTTSQGNVALMTSTTQEDLATATSQRTSSTMGDAAAALAPTARTTTTIPPEPANTHTPLTVASLAPGDAVAVTAHTAKTTTPTEPVFVTNAPFNESLGDATALYAPMRPHRGNACVSRQGVDVVFAYLLAVLLVCA